MLLSRILVYPIKALDGAAVSEARITAGGILEFDRIYTIVDKAVTCPPAWSNPDRFNHYYRFATNTSVPASEAGKWLRVGDPVSVG